MIPNLSAPDLAHLHGRLPRHKLDPGVVQRWVQWLVDSGRSPAAWQVDILKAAAREVRSGDEHNNGGRHE